MTSPLLLPVASIESFVLKLTPPELKKGSRYTFSICFDTILMTTRWPPNLPCKLPSEVVKPIFELSALLKAEARILVVDCALAPAGAY